MVVCDGVVALVLPVVLDVAALAIAAPPPARAAVAATVTSSGLILRIFHLLSSTTTDGAPGPSDGGRRQIRVGYESRSRVTNGCGVVSGALSARATSSTPSIDERVAASTTR